MISPCDIVECASLYLGTPYHHQGRMLGVGVDCIGLLAGVASRLGIPHQDQTDYSPRPDGASLERAMHKNLVPVSTDGTFQPGDIFVFWFMTRRLATHVGIAIEKGWMIHTFNGMHNGKVVRVPVDDFWKKRYMATFRFPNVLTVTAESLFPASPIMPPPPKLPCCGNS